MARRFPLEGLLRARRLAEERAAAGLELANRDRRSAQTAVDETTAKLASLTFDKESVTAGQASMGRALDWSATVATRASTTARIADLTVSLSEAATHAEAAAVAWGDARMRVTMIEKLGERHARRVLAEELAEEQLFLDEAALRRATEEGDH